MSASKQLLDVLQKRITKLNEAAAKLKNPDPYTDFYAAFILGSVCELSSIVVELGLADVLGENHGMFLNGACFGLMKNYIQGYAEARATEKH